MNRPNVRGVLALVLLAAVVWPTSAWAAGPPPVFLPLVTRNPGGAHAGSPGCGGNVAERSHAAFLVDLGFDWAKGFADPSDRENPYGPWKNVDNQLDAFLAIQNGSPRVRNVLLRVPGTLTPPPLDNLADFRNRLRDLAQHVRVRYREGGPLQEVAYEIWNEPNLRREWGGQNPSPAAYVRLLKAAYQGIKAGDPEALVVHAGLATGGDYNDLAFLRGVYQHGGKAWFDVLGSHPYGGSSPPAVKNGPVYFRRAEEQRQVMVQHGDGQKPVWATEFGWIVRRPASCPPDEHSWMEVSEAAQATYLVDAYQYAWAHWPWMGPMFLILDFGTVPWYARCEPLRWYSIYYRPYGDWTAPVRARPAVEALSSMPRQATPAAP